ncbi:MAG: SH3 domain-containing protein [Lachnospiraceae bacterium]|nr:SH3 domain-containing protein [Lachnospiraceae bacterium]
MKQLKKYRQTSVTARALGILGTGILVGSLLIAFPGVKVDVSAANIEDSGKTQYLLAMQALTGQVLLPEERAVVDSFRTAEDGRVAAKTDTAWTGRDTENEYANLAIAHVSNYVNVRSTPSTDGEILGKIYNGAVAQILETAGENNEWFHVLSGSVEGYIKSEYFIYGSEAAKVVDNYVTRYAVVKADRLNVRESADLAAKRIGYLDQGEKALLVEDDGEWLQVSYGGNKKGYVAAEYTTIAEEFVYAKSIEEEKAELEALRALQKRRETSEEHAPEIMTVAAPVTTYSSNSELRSQIVEYAKQFLGNKYVMGGTSLQSGTDCSGFTCFIYADFGYSISRTPSGQLSSAGRSIDYSEIQPGDIICYGKGSCSHVALYIGDGQIIHAANSRKGVVIYNADYDNILGVKNVID